MDPGKALYDEALAAEAMGEYERAAEMYKRASDMVQSENDKAVITSNAGLALKRAGKFSEAENMYLISFKHALCGVNASDFDPNQVGCNTGNLLLLYSYWSGEKYDTSTLQVLSSQEFEVGRLFSALLCMAKWYTSKDNLCNILTDGQTIIQKEMLSPEYATTAKARKVLFRALKTGDPEKFRMIILGAKKEHVLVAPGSHLKYRQGAAEEDKNTAKASAQTALVKEMGGIIVQLSGLFWK